MFAIDTVIKTITNKVEEAKTVAAISILGATEIATSAVNEVTSSVANLGHEMNDKVRMATFGAWVNVSETVNSYYCADYNITK